MCRLLGYAADRPRTTESILGGTQSAVFQDMAALHRDGWGSAWLAESPDRAEISAIRSAKTGVRDEVLTGVLTGTPARARITHLRMATDGMACEPQNTHPFVADGMAFAHNGSLVPTSLLDELIAPEIASQLHGDTDSERYFAVIRTALATGLSVTDAVHHAVTQIRASFPHASMNALLLSQRQLIAIHANVGAHVPYEDFDASGLSDENFPLDHRNAYYLMRQRRLDDGTIIFASSGLDIVGWDPLPSESIVTVDLRSLELEIRAIGENAHVDSTPHHAS